MAYIAPVFLKTVIVTLLILLQKTPQKSNPTPRFCAKRSFSGLILTLAKPVFTALKNVHFSPCAGVNERVGLLHRPIATGDRHDRRHEKDARKSFTSERMP
jgi:hypothetical protein